MSQADRWRVIAATLANRGFTEQQGASPEFRGSINVHGCAVDIELIIPDSKFVVLPTVRLVDRKQLPSGAFGHISRDEAVGPVVCFAPATGMPLDFHDPGGSVLRVLRQTELSLEKSFAGQGNAEVAAEYQDYWIQKEPSFRILVRRDRADERQASLQYAVFKPATGSPFFAIADTIDLMNHEATRLSGASIFQFDAKLGPTADLIVPNSFSSLEEWFRGQTSLVAGRWSECERALLSGKFVCLAANNCTLGVAVEIPANIAVAVRTKKIRSSKLQRILAKQKANLEIKRSGGYWTGLAEIAQRNLHGIKTLDGKAIAIVGCGTLGSHLAKFLIQSGAGASAPLTLIDGQVLSAGNIGRHYLGHSRIGEPKAVALAEELRSFHPQCDIRATVGDAPAQIAILADADLLVDATGEWNTQYALNELFYEDGISAAAILHCWISGNGAAVQAFLNVSGDECCFRCLRPSMDAGPRFPALKPGVEANMAPATCGDGNYIPYSVAAPATAAGLACDMAIGWANDKPGARLRTIVLDHERGIERKPTTPSAHNTCPSCLARDRS